MRRDQRLAGDEQHLYCGRAGAIQRELKVESEPEAMAAALRGAGFIFRRIGLEAEPLSQWLHAGLKAGLPVVLLETRAVVRWRKWCAPAGTRRCT